MLLKNSGWYDLKPSREYYTCRKILNIPLWYQHTYFIIALFVLSTIVIRAELFLFNKKKKMNENDSVHTGYGWDIPSNRFTKLSKAFTDINIKLKAFKILLLLLYIN